MRRRRTRSAAAARLRRLIAARAERGRGTLTAEGRGRAHLVGRDLAQARLRSGRPRRLLALALFGSLIAALALAALRIDLIRLRYALAETRREEKSLLEEHSLLTARMRSLRDPARLARLARDLEFVRPSRVIELDASTAPTGPRP